MGPQICHICISMQTLWPKCFVCLSTPIPGLSSSIPFYQALFVTLYIPAAFFSNLCITHSHSLLNTHFSGASQYTNMLITWFIQGSTLAKMMMIAAMWTQMTSFHTLNDWFWNLLVIILSAWQNNFNMPQHGLIHVPDGKHQQLVIHTMKTQTYTKV